MFVHETVQPPSGFLVIGRNTRNVMAHQQLITNGPECLPEGDVGGKGLAQITLLGTGSAVNATKRHYWSEKQRQNQLGGTQSLARSMLSFESRFSSTHLSNRYALHDSSGVTAAA